jgi:tRNA(Arg) A34 adenosine deaminase TadA
MPAFLPNYDLVHERLSFIDHVAAANVAAGLGGPFSASVLILTRGRKGAYRVSHTLPPTSNAVLSTGRASAHAEAQAMSPLALRSIETKLRKILTTREQADPRLVFLSSAQPCMACLSKIEIFARHLASFGLLEPRHFTLVYGAPFAETEKIAGFNDYPYALDFVRAGDDERNTRPLLVPIERVAFRALPETLRLALSIGGGARALVVGKSGRILAFGEDERARSGLFATAECVALANASRVQRDLGMEAPWDLRGATLYTLTQDVGPLAYAEAQWYGVGRIVCVPPGARGLLLAQTHESRDCRNAFLFSALADGFNNPKSALAVFRDETHENVAQEAWFLKTDRTMYNGTKADSAFARNDRKAFDARFTPRSLCACTIAEKQPRPDRRS